MSIRLFFISLAVIACSITLSSCFEGDNLLPNDENNIEDTSSFSNDYFLISQSDLDDFIAPLHAFKGLDNIIFNNAGKMLIDDSLNKLGNQHFINMAAGIEEDTGKDILTMWFEGEDGNYIYLLKKISTPDPEIDAITIFEEEVFVLDPVKGPVLISTIDYDDDLNGGIDVHVDQRPAIVEYLDRDGDGNVRAGECSLALLDACQTDKGCSIVCYITSALGIYQYGLEAGCIAAINTVCYYYAFWY